MEISTRKFGNIEIDESKIIEVPDGLLGFQEFKKFVLLTDSKTEPFYWFQSIEHSDLCMIFMEPYLFDPEYKLDLDELIAQREWEDTDPKDLDVYVAVVTIFDEDGRPKVTTNLMGPIIINSKYNEAFQVVVMNTGYSSEHVLGRAA